MKKLMTNKRTRMALVLPSVIAAGLFTIGAANADAGWFGKDKHDRGEHHYEKMEHLSDMLDMTDEQEIQLKEILKSAKEDRKSNKTSRREMRKEMMLLSPDDPEFMVKVEAQADIAASQVKAKMLTFAKIRKDVYAILTDEQKQKMQRIMEKRMKKMEGRRGKGDDGDS